MDILEIVAADTMEVVEVAGGATGPPGPPGAIGGAHKHTQTSAASTWTIVHPLTYLPNVSVLDADNNLLDAAIAWPNATTVVVTLAANAAGTALLS